MEFIDTGKKKVLHRTLPSFLYNREINGMKTRNCSIKPIYQKVFPNCTIFDVKTPHCYIRKFTPDGRQLLAFSEDLTSIELYDYFGCAMAADLLKNFQNNLINEYSDENVSLKLFNRLFQLRYRIKITAKKEYLNRECSLFTENGYALVVSATHVFGNLRSHHYQIYSNNEAMSPNPLYPLENYTVYLVNINCGVISDSIQFKWDKIYISHNQGIYLLKNTLAILSIQHQVIHIYTIVQNRLCLQRKIGRFCFEDDFSLISSVYTCMNHSSYRPYREHITNGLKQKLLIFLYKKAEQEVQKTGLQDPLKKFHHYFYRVLSLRMWKMQLLGENYLFIRYSAEEVVTLKIEETYEHGGLFMIYDIDTAKVLDVFENSSGELLEIFEHHIDYFNYPHTNLRRFLPCSPANNIYIRALYENLKKVLTETLPDKETNRTILTHLPIAAQSFTSTPYFDYSLFIFNEKLVSPMDRPIMVHEHSIKFHSRDSGLLNFCLYTKKSNVPIRDVYRLIVFIFHPTDPFAISVQRENFEFIVNFHIRKVYMSE